VAYARISRAVKFPPHGRTILRPLRIAFLLVLPSTILIIHNSAVLLTAVTQSGCFVDIDPWCHLSRAASPTYSSSASSSILHFNPQGANKAQLHRTSTSAVGGVSRLPPLCKASNFAISPKLDATAKKTPPVWYISLQKAWH